ncbi:MAG: M15 family metallopeptidase [Bacteroidales bacterium]|nr:M15 family metallopeptidase [Bacteroidales bacterium]
MREIIEVFRRLFALIMISALIGSCSETQQVNEYGLIVISSPEAYAKLVKKNPDQELVNLRPFLLNTQFDIRYATSNNFTGEVVYESSGAYLCKAAADSLHKVVDYLFGRDLGLKIFDAYRPYQATLKFWEIVKDPAYAAAPETGSRHNRGCAIDVTLITLADSIELDMPTAFDDFTVKAASDYMEIPDHIIKNRLALKTAMELFGFSQLSSEWWHFDFTGWENYPVLDISFEDLPVQ